MDGAKLAKANIKIKMVTLCGEDYMVCFEYQWRDSKNNPIWSADATTVPAHGEWGNGPDRATTMDDIRAWVNAEVIELRAELED